MLYFPVAILSRCGTQGPSIKYVTLEWGVRESVTVCDIGEVGVKSM